MSDLRAIMPNLAILEEKVDETFKDHGSELILNIKALHGVLKSAQLEMVTAFFGIPAVTFFVYGSNSSLAKIIFIAIGIYFIWFLFKQWKQPVQTHLIFRRDTKHILADSDLAPEGVQVASKKTINIVLSFIILPHLLIIIFLDTINSAVIFDVVLGISTLIVASTLFWLSGQRWNQLVQTYTNLLMRKFVPFLSNLFNILFEYIPAYEHKEETESLFIQSGLAGEEYDSFAVEEMFNTCGDLPVSFRKVHTSKKVGSGKSSSRVPVFYGFFVVVTLPNRLSGATYISTESEKNKLEHKSSWEQLNSPFKIKETELEWNEFEKEMYVASDNPVEARYILTPNFMVDLYDWWSEGKDNIRICFKEDKMMILLPNGINDELNSALDIEQVKNLFFTMTRQIWRTFLLVEKLPN